MSEWPATVEKTPLILERIWKLYEDTVGDQAELVFDFLVRPFCEKHSLRFVTGNGDWYLQATEESIRDNRTAIADLLSTPIPGMPSNDLGSLMPSYTPEE